MPTQYSKVEEQLKSQTESKNHNHLLFSS